MDPRSSRAVRDQRRLSRKNSAADKEQEEELARKAMVSKAAALTGIANHMAELNDQMLAGLRAAHVQTPPAAKVNTALRACGGKLCGRRWTTSAETCTVSDRIAAQSGAESAVR